ncbi:uncharacterized protein VICG_01273 [Vittaforma corneae ATCC 50505]|uniref:Phosphofructokinase domain-containing protein n=1 Tax=Vittaforma corneae (strain ATCC 50505) TaxID=993615 RepID=L2GMD4_VITCO|nr:uncharacterized protein VICG_01273 [Vittaforma corneae ATCC 50505]ELA41640.1 hypothetical protein VICG_01273 [Vittaforma corneae ATCC 50505]
MRGYIDELVIEDDKVSQDTVSLYESLGLFATLNNTSIKLCSTRDTYIKSFDGNLRLCIGRKHYDEIMNQKLIEKRKEQDQTVIYDNIGTEIILEAKKSYSDIRLGVLTSGGDSPGMNSAVRSIVRYSLKNNIKVFGIYRGFEGLIRGDIRELGWDNETHSSGQSGTYLLSARSEKFKTRKGRKEAAFNLLVRNINALVVIGGEGSMEGALILKEEFKELCEEIIAEGWLNSSKIETIKNERTWIKDSPHSTTPVDSISQSDKLTTKSLSTEKVEDVIVDYLGPEASDEFNFSVKKPYDIQIVGIPGTIDNDIIGTDFTLGSNTAITRVAEVVEKLTSTMRSHKRVFVLECMGRNCGWITLMAGFAIGAEYIFIPEAPPKDWRCEMIKSLKTAYFNHKMNIFVFVSEGAIDSEGNRITTSEIKQEIRNAGMEVRSLVLGHVQRGGMTAAQDRFLGTVFGLKIVEYIMGGSNIPVMAANVSDEFIFVDLYEVVRKSKMVRKYFIKKRYDEVLKMRNEYFQQIYWIHERYRHSLSQKFFKEHLYPREYSIGYLHAHNEKKLDSSSLISEKVEKLFMIKKRLRIGVLMEGPSSGGMNTVLNSLVQFGLCKDVEIFYFFNGYNGMINVNVRKADLFEFSLVDNQGGIIIGTSDTKNVDINTIERRIEELQIDYLIVVGGTVNLKLARTNTKIIIIPCTISNNFPGSDMSIGSDTALNAILIASEACRLTAMSIKKTVYVIEIAGGKCGYLTVIGGISCSVFDVISPKVNKLEDLILTKKKIKTALEKQGSNSVMIFRNESTFDYMTTESLCKILCSDESIAYNYSVLGHLERGILPSVLDRIHARLSAYKAIEVCLNQVTSGVIGICNGKAIFSSVESVLKNYDEMNDTTKNPKWQKYSTICSLME